ncbi:MAG: hypothetical protein PHP83_00460 [Clostridia bacterium]|nr:hypothetical protein [Clostridia bacterium]
MKKVTKAKIKHIKAYKKMLKSELFDVDNELRFTETGSAIIECNVLNLDNIFSKFDTQKDGTFSDDFNTYLLNELLIIPLQYPLELQLHVYEDFSESDELNLRKTLKRNFKYNITTDKVRMKKNNFASIVLYLLGALALGMTVLTQKITYVLPLYETFLILTWFCVWEGTNKAFFDRNKLRSHRFNMLRLYNANVTIIRDIKRTIIKETIYD